MNSSPAVIPHGRSRPTATLLANGRLRIHLDLSPGQLAPPKPEPPQLETRNSKLETFLEVRVGSSSFKFPYYKTRWKKYTSYTMTWHDGLKRQREKRSSVKALRARAEEVAKAIVNGQTAMLRFGQSDQASYLRALQLLAPSGSSLEVAAGIYADCVQILSGRSVLEAVREYAAQNPIGTSRRDSDRVADEFLAELEVCHKWNRNLVFIVRRFVTDFPGPLSTLTPKLLSAWLAGLKEVRTGLKVGRRTRRNYFNILARFFKFARSRGDLGKDCDPLESVTNPKPPAPEIIPYTPEEMIRVLNYAESKATGRKLVPFMCITAFARVRHGEMNEENKMRVLEWSDVNFAEKRIIVRKKTAKTGLDRIIVMTNQLIDWLKPYARPAGKICEVKHTGSALCRLFKKAGVQHRQNGLRKSAITYEEALKQNLEQVAKDSGNSPKVIRESYLGVEIEYAAVAERWYAIRRPPADMEPLFLWARQPGELSPSRHQNNL